MKNIFILVKSFVTVIIFILLPAVIFILLTSNTTLVPGLRSFVVLSGSMEPKIRVGSMVFAQKTDFYTVGDVISFTNKKNETITHRIIERIPKTEGNYYQVKGDANNTSDTDLIPEKSVVGEVVFAIPIIGTLTYRLRTPIGFISFIITPAVIFIALELLTIKKELEKEVEKRVLAKLEDKNETA